MKKTSRWLAIGLFTLVLGLAAGGGAAFFLAYQRSANNCLKAGENSYAAGCDAFAKLDDANACLRFHEALLQAEQALKEIEQTRAEQKELTPEQQTLLVHQEGLAHWLKLKAIRARAASKVRGEGKPLPPLDGVSPDQGRDYFAKLTPSRLPDEAMRQEAIGCLRLAALRLTDVEEIQREAVNQEMQFEPKQWPIAERLASQLLALQPKDEKARYLLARHEYEQPQVAANGGPSTLLPPVKRSRDRMRKALEHLECVKAAEKTPRWRTSYLEAQIHSWLVNHWRQPNHKKPAEEQQALAALKALLHDEDGALPRAAEADSFGPLSRLDTEGILYLHLLALDLAIEAERRQDQQANGAAAPANVGKLLEALAKATAKITAKEPTPLQVGLCFDALSLGSLKAMAFVVKDGTPIWPQTLAATQKLAKEAQAQNQGELISYLRVAELVGREAERLGKQGQAATLNELRGQALAWIDAGLKQGQVRKLPAAAMLPFHEVAARLKGQMGGKREALAIHLDAMKQAEAPVMQAMAFLMEGAFFEKEGRLDKARDLMERAAYLGAGSDVARRAHTALANLQLALNQPQKALASLREVEKAYGRWDQLADEEKAWLFEFLRSPQEVQLLKLQAHLACAAEGYRRLALQGSQAGPDAIELMKQHELEAAQLLNQLGGVGPVNRLSREKLVAHLAATQRLDQAADQLATLRRDYPDNVNVFKLENQLALAKAPPAERAKLVGVTEARIRQFVQANPTSVEAKLYWGEWLLNVGRAAEAVAYLNDPAQFPAAAADARLQRLRTVAQLTASPATPSPIQQVDGKDPLLDLAVIQASGTTEDKQKQVGDALVRYENNGLFRCAAAKLAEQRKDYAEAARGYCGALEITRVRPLARAGLQNVLLTFAQQNPTLARELAAQLLQELPAEPTLLLAYAECCFQLGEFGDPAAKATQVQDLATALAAYEQAIGRENPSDPSGPWLKAQYWRRANRADFARGEVARLLTRFPEHEGGLAFVVQLALEEGQPESCGTALGAAEKLRKKQPDSPLPCLFVAQLQRKLGQTKEAKATLENCVTAYPQCSGAYAALVDLLGANGEAAAMPIVRAWRKNLPTDLLAAQAEVRHLAGSGQLQEARAVLESTTKALVSTMSGGSMMNTDRREGLPALLATLTLSRGLMQAKAYGEAESWLKRLLETQPDREEALLLLGDLYLTQLRATTNPAERAAFAKEAQAAFAKVYAQRKGHLIAGNNLAWLLAAEGGDAEEALRLLKEVRANRHTQKPLPAESLPADVLDTFGLAYAQANSPLRCGEAAELFQAARRRYPADPRFCLHLGRAMQGAGKRPEAEQLFAAAQTLAAKPNCGVPPEELPKLQAAIAAARAAGK